MNFLLKINQKDINVMYANIIFVSMGAMTHIKIWPVPNINKNSKRIKKKKKMRWMWVKIILFSALNVKFILKNPKVATIWHANASINFAFYA